MGVVERHGLGRAHVYVGFEQGFVEWLARQEEVLLGQSLK